MKSAEDVADKLITVNLLKLETFRDALIQALTAFADKRVKEECAPYIKNWREAVRAEGLKEGQNDLEGLFRMRICECTHKESGHGGRKGKCERCECHAFSLSNPYEKGFAECREMAAKTVEELFFQALGKNEEAEKWLAEQIRALKTNQAPV